ncbi:MULTISPECIES: Pro-rich N-terminal domain-containing protein [Streptomyces]|uniref:Pro-rich N-terminal domain-containing protein n=1 Tax=Streptomyces TaxID=1883 RepID=UPI00069B4D5B|nr:MULTISPECIES: Pro-rich N-terminal domain-containing protein [Streptomyces]MYU55731.1 AAA family ATPase [Streptomyces sp. SID7805]WSK11245.1 ATP-binding protein [Streptomyces celluloflavus]
MQHAVGAPLPPPRRQVPGPGAGMHWTPHPGPPIPPGSPPSPPVPPAPAAPPVPPAPGGPAPGGPGWGGPAPRQAPPAPHSADLAGHVRLPPGAPVALPSPQADSAAQDAAHAAVAVLLIGPAGAGKTSVARHWAGIRRVPTAHISLDDVREWVRAGFADPQAGWNDHSEAQYRLARRTCGFAARNFLANGISCILDDAVFPDRPVVGLGGWKRHVGPGLLPVVLLPGLEIVLERNARRSGNRRLSDEEVARIHGRMAGWYGSGLPIIDNSAHDVATTVRVLDDVVARSIASPPSW